eukprot:TRINITY_DN980_c0_g1_i4.p1 TRINITY_DN980_c0_g1~~TRINITY_DN980_c0_g1_i4.p1  ORF type:complete len:338 (+),score=14.02 TRINITY_DN980_c0_g1_i4:181-1194(+)
MKMDEKMVGRFRLGRKLGSGSQGVVRVCHDASTGESMGACKTITLKNDDFADNANLIPEVKALWSLKGHKHIVRLLEIHTCSKKAHLIMELCAHGNLYSFLEKHDFQLPEPQAARVIAQLLTALIHCHSNGIVHRDIKPENILVSHLSSFRIPLFRMNSDSRLSNLKASKCLSPEPVEAYIKLADFGMAVQTSNGDLTEFERCGSLSFMAPEMMMGLQYNKEVDMWSTGILTFFILMGYAPFHGTNLCEVLAAIQWKGPFLHMEATGKLSVEAWDFIRHLLCDQADRMSAADALAHPWIQLYWPEGFHTCKPPTSKLRHALSLKNPSCTNHEHSCCW